MLISFQRYYNPEVNSLKTYPQRFSPIVTPHFQFNMCSKDMFLKDMFVIILWIGEKEHDKMQIS